MDTAEQYDEIISLSLFISWINADVRAIGYKYQFSLIIFHFLSHKIYL